jgi:hypothetical protein
MSPVEVILIVPGTNLPLLKEHQKKLAEVFFATITNLLLLKEHREK